LFLLQLFRIFFHTPQKLTFIRVHCIRYLIRIPIYLILKNRSPFYCPTSSIRESGWGGERVEDEAMKDVDLLLRELTCS
jgi:hypothetical protein